MNVYSRFLCPLAAILLFVVSFASAEDVMVDHLSDMLASRETLLSVQFRNGSAVLDYTQVDKIDMIADRLREIDQSRYMIRIEGSASPEGTFEQNIGLSFARSEAVWKYLRIAHQLDPASFYLTGLGPQAGDRKDWSKLRRADIVVYKLSIVLDETANLSSSPR